MRKSCAAAHHPVSDHAAIRELSPSATQHGDGVWRHLDVVAADQPHRREEAERDGNDQNREPQSGIWQEHGALA